MATDEMEDARKRAAQSRKETETRGRFTLPEGETTFRILQTPSDQERGSPFLFVQFNAHSDVGPKKRWLRCGIEPGEMNGDCWLCNKADGYDAKGKTAKAAALRPREQFGVQVAVLDKDTDEMMGPLMWTMGKGKTAKSLSYIIQGVVSSKKGTEKKWLDHHSGYNMSMKRVGTGKLDTVYGSVERDDERTAVPKGIIKRLKPFVDVIPRYDEDVMKAAYYGTEEATNKESNDSMATKKKHHREEEESSSSAEVEPSESSEEGSSEEEKPKKKVKAKKKEPEPSESSEEKSSSEEESSSEPEPSESSEEKPKKKKKKEPDSSEEASEEESSSEKEASESSEEEKPKKKKKTKPEPSESSEEASSEPEPSESSEEEKPKKKPVRRKK